MISPNQKYHNLFHALCGLLLGSGMVGASGYYLLSVSMTRAELIERGFVAAFGLILFLVIVAAAARKLWSQSNANINRLESMKTPEYKNLSEYIISNRLWLPALLTIVGVFLFGLFSWLVLHGVLEVKNVGTLQILFLLVGMIMMLFSVIAAIYYMIKR